MAFYDAVLLFSYALNNTITELGEDLVFNSPFNSTKIATNMWGKTFQGEFCLIFIRFYWNFPFWRKFLGKLGKIQNVYGSSDENFIL